MSVVSRSAMKVFFKCWDKLWFSRFDPLSVSLFRIFLGILILVMFLANAPNWDRFYGAYGIPSLHDLDLNRPSEDSWSLFYWTEGKIPVGAYWWLGFLAALAFTIGWKTRWATILLYALQTSMIHRNLAIVNGDDLVLRMLLFYSCFAPLNHCLSVDWWLKKKRERAEGPVSESEWPLIWPIRMMQINIAFIYLISLPYKLLGDPGWLNGDEIYWVMASSMWSRWPWPQVFCQWNGLLSKIFTYGTIASEACFPTLVWFRPTKLYVLAAIAALHLGIAFVIPNVAFFTLAMVCSFWVFVPASRIREWLGRLRDSFSKKYSMAATLS